MNCRKCKIEIDERDLRRESLSGAAQAHLGICASCRVFSEERLALSHLVGELEKFPAPADFDFRMRARMAAEIGARSTHPGWFSFSPAALSWPLAGCLALLITASLYLQQKQPTGMTTPGGQTSALSPTPMIEKAKNLIEQATDNDPKPIIDAPAVKVSLPQRRRVLPVQIGADTRVKIATFRETPLESNTSGVTGAAMKFAVSSTSKGESDMIPVQLTAPERPLKVLLRDTSGGERTISVDSVSFGSRDVMGRSATFKKASLSSNQGVW